jgi:hypothetical protein
MQIAMMARGGMGRLMRHSRAPIKRLAPAPRGSGFRPGRIGGT